MLANPFPSYLEMRQPLPLWFWHAVRAVFVTGAFGLVVLLFVQPRLGLITWWLFVLPCIPLLLMLAPGSGATSARWRRSTRYRASWGSREDARCRPG
jgi:hypothetical protein